jgi:hypothetical protein
VALYLREHEFDVWRMAPAGADDQGDIGGLKDWAFEVRNRQWIELSENVDDANALAVVGRSRLAREAATGNEDGDNEPLQHAMTPPDPPTQQCHPKHGR